MNLNPFADELEIAAKISSVIDADLQRNLGDVSWYESTDTNHLRKQVSDLECSYDSLAISASEVDRELERLANIKINLVLRVGAIWNPKNWFNKEQIKYRKEYSTIEKMFTEKQKYKSKIWRDIGVINDHINKHNDDINRHKSFDIDAYRERIAKLEVELRTAEHKIYWTRERKQEVDKILAPVINQLDQNAREIQNAEEAKRQAQEIDCELSNAANSYERAMLHQCCEDEFGIPSPKKVISQKENDIRRLNRDRQKLERRATLIAKKASREIQLIVVDGNNLCYEGDIFIGLRALRALIPVLTKSYNVTVVFDASIRHLLKRGDTDIRADIGSKVKVHIVSTSSKADETVLDLANDNELTYIISNDRFGEFKDKPAVNGGRIIRHEIVEGRIMIHDLGIDQQYEI